MFTMHDMRLTSEEQLDDSLPCVPIGKEIYPYGLRICLTEKELVKLGLDPKEASVGGMFHGHFMARVTCVSENETSDGANSRVEAQIESLCIESEDMENEEAEEAAEGDSAEKPKPRARKLYG